MSRKPIITSSSILLCSILSATVWADGHSPEEGAQPLKLQDVTVTGTKEGEVNLQDVPSAISAYTEDDINDAGIKSIKDLRSQTPSLNLTHNGQSARLYMRGIGSNLDFVGTDPSVTVHVDGVYQSRTTGVLEDFLDLERIEVLRGPQGTLYGRNSTGGTINLISNKPEAETKGKLFAEAGSYKLQTAGGMINGTILEDKVLGRLAIAKTKHDPYVKNEAATGVDGLMDDDSVTTRGSLRFLMDEKSELLLRADYTDIDRNPGAYKTTLTAVDGSPSAMAGLVSRPDDPWAMNVSDIDPYTSLDAVGASAEYTRELSSNLTLVSLTGYKDTELGLREDTDGSNVDYLYTEHNELQTQISEELRLQYKDEKLSWVAGLFYLQEEQESDTAINVTLANIRSTFDAENELTAYAAFGQGTYAVSDELNATIGLRYSKEEKEFKNVALAYSVDEKQDWDSWSPKIGFDYSPDDDSMLYGSISKGFKSGGYNLTAADAEFEPEEVVSYELGAKSQSADKQFSYNTAIFYSDYQDLQVQNFIVPGQITITNAADASIQGFELETQWLPTYDWMFSFNYTYLDADYKSYVLTTGDASGHDMVASPEQKINLATQYYYDIPSGTFSYRLEYSWTDMQYFTAPNQEVSMQDSYALVNARIAFESADEVWEAQVYGENLTNEAYSTSSREFPAAVTGITKDINPPRTFGVRLVRNF
jgi:iron complex outermembrane receptor protein